MEKRNGLWLPNSVDEFRPNPNAQQFFRPERSKLDLNFEYDPIYHTDRPFNYLIDLSIYDFFYWLELHYPFTDLKYFNGIIKRSEEQTKAGYKVGMGLIGDNVDTPKNGKIRGDYPKKNPKEVVEGFKIDILDVAIPYLKVWIISNHDFELIHPTDSVDEKIGANIWRDYIPKLKEQGVFISKRIVKVKLRYDKRAVFEHEHLMETTVKNRAWKFNGYDYRIFAGNHNSFRNENVYEDGTRGENHAVPPCVTWQFQYNEERMQPPLVARVLEIDQTQNPIKIGEL